MLLHRYGSTSGHNLTLICFCSLTGLDVLLWCLWEHNQAFCCKIFMPELISAAIGMSGEHCGNIVCVYDGEHKRETSIFYRCSHALVALKNMISLSAVVQGSSIRSHPRRKKKSFSSAHLLWPTMELSSGLCEWLRARRCSGAMAPFNTKV